MLSIIIVNYYSTKHIDKCIRSLAIFEPEFNLYEILIIDNANDIELRRMLTTMPANVRVIQSPSNGGFASANNIGIREAKGDILLLLNPDTYVTDNSIEKLYRRILNDDAIDIIGPKLLYPDGTNQSYFHPKSFLNIRRLLSDSLGLHRIFKNSRILNDYFRTYMNYDRETYVEQICGAAIMFKKHAIERIGLLDEHFFMYFEESDLCKRAITADMLLLFFPNSTVFHVGGLTSCTNLKLARYYVMSLKYFFKKHYGINKLLVAMCIYFLGLGVRIVVFFFKNKKKYYYYKECLHELLIV